MVIKLDSFLQFPTSGEVIEIPAISEHQGKYAVNMDIGWNMRRQNSYATNEGMKTAKTYMGSVHCINEGCTFFNTEIRPKRTMQLVKSQCEQGCNACKQKLVHISSSVRAIFTCYGDVCRLYFGDRQEGKEHTHEKYEVKYLSDAAKQEFEQHVLANTLATPKSLVAGLNKATERYFPLREIHPALQNLDRTTYETKSVLRKHCLTKPEESTIEQL